MHESRTSLLASLRALPRGAWILFLGTFLNKFGTFVLPFLAIYMTGLGYTAAQSGLAISAYGIGSLCASLLGGWLADRMGRRKTIVLSMFSVSVAMMWLSQVRSLGMMTFCAALAGLTGELYRPASSALLADLLPAGQRVTAFAAYRMAFNAGWAFGPATAGLLAQKSFLWLFIGDAATSFLYGVLAWFALPRGRRGSRADGSLFETVRVLRSDKAFSRVLLAAFAVGLVFVQTFSTMSIEVTKHGFTASTYGLLASLNGVLVVLFELPLTTITKRHPPHRMMALGYLLIGLSLMTNLSPRLLPFFIMTITLLTFGEMISMPVAGAYVADLAPPDQRGRYMGTYGLMWSLAFICGPSLGLMLFSVNRIALWTLCGCLGVLAAIVISCKTPAATHPNR